MVLISATDINKGALEVTYIHVKKNVISWYSGIILVSTFFKMSFLQVALLSMCVNNTR
jgi:hypothetical protein